MIGLHSPQYKAPFILIAVNMPNIYKFWRDQACNGFTPVDGPLYEAAVELLCSAEIPPLKTATQTFKDKMTITCRSTGTKRSLQYHVYVSTDPGTSVPDAGMRLGGKARPVNDGNICLFDLILQLGQIDLPSGNDWGTVRSQAQVRRDGTNRSRFDTTNLGEIATYRRTNDKDLQEWWEVEGDGTYKVYTGGPPHYLQPANLHASCSSDGNTIVIEEPGGTRIVALQTQKMPRMVDAPYREPTAVIWRAVTCSKRCHRQFHFL